MPSLSYARKTPFTFVFRLGRLAFELTVIGVIAGALWLAASAAYENIHFVRTTGQILSLIAIARDDAAKEPAFGRAGEDLMESLLRRGQIPGVRAEAVSAPGNAWGGAIRAEIVSPTVMRFETDLPTRDCRRLALFFGKDAADLALLSMEARDQNGPWRQFYDQSSNQQLGPSAADAACGWGEHATLALTLRLR
jgi:hypothetical protein